MQILIHLNKRKGIIMEEISTRMFVYLLIAIVVFIALFSHGVHKSDNKSNISSISRPSFNRDVYRPLILFDNDSTPK